MTDKELLELAESIERYLAGSPVTKGERTRLVRARDEITRLRKSATPCKQWEWVGLTGLEMDNLWEDWRDGAYRSHLDFGKAIEAKLKEKNT